MGRTLYCSRCLNSFQRDADRCPNLACGMARPELGWGALLGPGDLLDRHYRVIRRLAVGGAGITYLARETDELGEPTGDELAIKVLYQKQDGTFLRRLANEARVLQDLDHDHIVKSRGFVHRTGQPAYLVTLYAPGGTLYDHVRHAGALEVRVACAIAEQVLDALAVAHRRGVVHRDLKPQNIFLREVVPREQVPHVLVADFGIAKTSGFMGDGLTTVGTFLGTPEFAAPEQFKGLPTEPPSDVFAAMCVLWFCLTGTPPLRFPDRTDLVGCLRVLRESLPPSLPAHVADASTRRALDALFARTLVADPAERWSIGAVLEALAELDAPSDPGLTPLQAEMGTLAPPPDADTSPVHPPVAAPRPAPTSASAGSDASRSVPEPSSTPTPGPTTSPSPPDRPSAPAAPRSAPSRVRLRPETASTPPPASGFDALFGASDEAIVDLRAPREPELSLEDLFAPPAPEPAPTEAKPAPAPASAQQSPPPVLDAAWETLAAPATPTAEPPSAPDAPTAEPAVSPAPAATSPAAPAPAWSPEVPASYDAVPATPRDQLDALGRCPIDARPALIAALGDPTSTISALPASASPALLCGAALAVAELGIERCGAWARALLAHDHPDVRATAALAVGATGKAGQLGLISRLLADPDARVRLASVHALRALGERSGRQDVIVDWLTPLAADADPRVRRAATGS